MSSYSNSPYAQGRDGPQVFQYYAQPANPYQSQAMNFENGPRNLGQTTYPPQYLEQQNYPPQGRGRGIPHVSQFAPPAYPPQAHEVNVPNGPPYMGQPPNRPQSQGINVQNGYQNFGSPAFTPPQAHGMNIQNGYQNFGQFNNIVPSYTQGMNFQNGQPDFRPLSQEYGMDFQNGHQNFGHSVNNVPFHDQFPGHQVQNFPVHHQSREGSREAPILISCEEQASSNKTRRSKSPRPEILKMTVSDARTPKVWEKGGANLAKPEEVNKALQHKALGLRKNRFGPKKDYKWMDEKLTANAQPISTLLAPAPAKKKRAASSTASSRPVKRTKASTSTSTPATPITEQDPVCLVTEEEELSTDDLVNDLDAAYAMDETSAEPETLGSEQEEGDLIIEGEELSTDDLVDDLDAAYAISDNTSTKPETSGADSFFTFPVGFATQLEANWNVAPPNTRIPDLVEDSSERSSPNADADTPADDFDSIMEFEATYPLYQQKPQEESEESEEE